MASERRYDENEIEEIFEAAASPGESRRSLPSAEGLTLSELQTIGREVGIPPERIAQAASGLARAPGTAARRTSFGMPIAVMRSVELPRPLTEHEWALLAADLRETFGARGRESSHGNTHQWTNGNLHAYVEPTPAGFRLRLGTVKGNALMLNRIGLGALAIGTILSITMLLTGQAVPEDALMITGMGAAAFIVNAVRLPGWARERQRQMEAIAGRVRALLTAPGVTSGGDIDG